MLKVFVLGLIGALICTILTAGVGFVISILKNDCDKGFRAVVGAVTFVISFIWLTFFLYVSCKEQTWLAVVKWMWPALIVDVIIYVIGLCDTKEIIYELISAIVLTVMSVSICFSTLFGPVQNLVYVHDMENIDITYAVTSDEILAKVELKIDEATNKRNKYFVEKPEMRKINGEDVAVYHIKDNTMKSTKYIPGYAIQKKNELPKIVSKRIYFDTSYINKRDALRTIRRKYPTVILGDHKFDVDDNWNPYEVFEYREKQYSTDGKDYGLIVLNLMDGTCEKYPAEENQTPSWIDFKTTYPR